MVVGGLAVVVHGYPRFTGNIDIWMKISDDNANKILEVIKDFGMTSLGITKADLLEKDGVIQFGVRPVRIDIMNDLAGISFDAAFEKKKQLTRADVVINFIGLNDLLISKKVAGRKQDKADIQKLKRINKLK